MNTIRQIFQTSLLLLFLTVLHPLSAIANTDVRQLRSPDRACLQCHKLDKEKMEGAHATHINPNSQTNITCSNCHGKIASDHRSGVADVMRYTPDQRFFTPTQQNSMCMSCHQPKELQSAFWVHDVHVLKTSCTNCHQLHTVSDPMQGISEKAQIKLCVDCHSQLQIEKVAP